MDDDFRTIVVHLKALLAQADVKTALMVLTAIVSAWLFLRRYSEEAKKTRLVHLETKALDELFRFSSLCLNPSFSATRPTPVCDR
jgi:hypothetical protein